MLEVKRRPFRGRLRTLMVLVAVSALGTWASIRWYGPVRESIREWRLNRPIWSRLDSRVDFRDPDGVALKSYLARFKPLGLTVLVDPIALQDADLDIRSIGRPDPRATTARRSLESALGPVGLGLVVRGGSLIVTNRADLAER